MQLICDLAGLGFNSHRFSGVIFGPTFGSYFLFTGWGIFLFYVSYYYRITALHPPNTSGYFNHVLIDHKIQHRKFRVTYFKMRETIWWQNTAGIAYIASVKCSVYKHANYRTAP